VSVIAGLVSAISIIRPMREKIIGITGTRRFASAR